MRRLRGAGECWAVGWDDVCPDVGQGAGTTRRTSLIDSIPVTRTRLFFQCPHANDCLIETWNTRTVRTVTILHNSGEKVELGDGYLTYHHSSLRGFLPTSKQSNHLDSETDLCRHVDNLWVKINVVATRGNVITNVPLPKKSLADPVRPHSRVLRTEDNPKTKTHPLPIARSSLSSYDYRVVALVDNDVESDGFCNVSFALSKLPRKVNTQDYRHVPL